LGRIGSLEYSEDIIGMAIEKIESGEIEQNRITKTCIVIDEAQDMSTKEFEMLKILKEKNEDVRIIAVGDDDQNIYEFRGSNSEYFASMLEWKNRIKYELLENYRSKVNIVNFANNFAKNINKRMKSNLIEAVQKENGKIKITECESENVTWSVVSDILETSPIGSICVLANTNQEVLEIAGMLSKSNRAVKIIQSNNDFSLFDILEVRCFYDDLGESAVVLDDTWKKAKQKLNSRFKNTNGLEIAENIIREFEQSNPQTKYKTDFEVFILESKLEDFSGENSTDTIFVSTMHKAKGKEFDNVFIMLNNFYADTDEKKRVLYVALTRAKNLLHIHFHGYNVFGIKNNEQGIEFIHNNIDYPPVNIITMFLTQWNGDLYLDHFKNKQKEIEKLNGNENLQVGDLFKFSREFKRKIEELKSRGYGIKEIKVNFIVYWKNKDMSKEIKIILPRVEFVKS